MTELLAYALFFFEICQPFMIKVKSCTYPLQMNNVYRISIMKLDEIGDDATGLIKGAMSRGQNDIDNNSWIYIAHISH